MNHSTKDILYKAFDAIKSYTEKDPLAERLNDVRLIGYLECLFDLKQIELRDFMRLVNCLENKKIRSKSDLMMEIGRMEQETDYE